jgi:alkylation response protein AidB-like acyl-CoA dehydrogenase
MAVGLANGAYKEAARHALKRRQFGKPIIQFQAIQHLLADMSVKIETARAMTYKSGWYSLVSNHPQAARFAAMAKYYSAEAAMQVTTDALQIHGGYGFVKECPVEKMFRDAKILSIYEGTSQMMKNQIGLSIMQDAARFQREVNSIQTPPACESSLAVRPAMQ